MRFKFLHVLTVCVVTLAVLSPELVVFDVVWGKHIELVESQQLTCEVDKCNISKTASATQEQSTNLSQDLAGMQLSDANIVRQIMAAYEQYKITKLLEWFFLLVPICIGLGIILYDRYLVYRSAIFQQQVEMLERLWRQSIEQ
ncbi:MAG: hypothetical protein ACHBN1_27980 [Heteroscytonema crispum UTEX LB 1556]